MNLDLTLWQALVTILTTIKNVPVARSSQANRYNWMDEFEEGNLPKVFWIVDIQPSVEEDWAMDAQCYRYPVTIFYVRPANLAPAEVTAGTTVESAIEARLSEVRDALIAYSGTAFQLAGSNPTRDISAGNPANDVFFELQDGFTAGAVSVSPLVGLSA